jgi:parallel beta-helix repeat protein
VTTPPVTTSPTPPVVTVPTAPSGAGRTVNVSTSAQLTAALAGAHPGDVINLADGTYTGTFTSGTFSSSFGTTVAGTATQPITLSGSRKAILEGSSLTKGYVLLLSGANYWVINGISITGAQKGIVLDQSNHDTITNVAVYNIGDEGIHVRDFSSDNTISGSTVTETGKSAPAYGEGIYLGSANSNWATYSGGKPDNSDRNIVTNNTISLTGAENIDIKEGTTGGIITYNHFDGTGMSGQNFADSWIDVKGNNYTVSNNIGVNSINDGFQVHSVLTGWGYNNILENNIANVNGPGYGFNVQSSAKGSIIYCNNTVTGAALGYSNVTCVKP